MALPALLPADVIHFSWRHFCVLLRHEIRVSPKGYRVDNAMCVRRRRLFHFPSRVHKEPLPKRLFNNQQSVRMSSPVRRVQASPGPHNCSPNASALSLARCMRAETDSERGVVYEFIIVL